MVESMINLPITNHQLPVTGVMSGYHRGVVDRD
jgi:hypothetical protein